MNRTVSWYHPDDLPAIEALHQRSRLLLPPPPSWRQNLAARDLCVITRHGDAIVGALCVQLEDSPVSWARWAIVGDRLDLGEWLELSLSPIFVALHSQGVKEVAWLDHTGGAGPSLRQIGFKLLTRIITLTKADRSLPCVGAANTHIRRAVPSDAAALLTIDRAAFVPYWWTGDATLRDWAATSHHFSVAQHGDELVGYAAGESSGLAAHFNRIAVHPRHQHRGVGSLLLRGGLRSFWQHGARRITLNTQIDNIRALRLYRHFRFEREGDDVASFHLQLQAGE